MRTPGAARLGSLAHAWEPAPLDEYAYVLGMYLGDGYISRAARTYRLRITLDAAYPRIVDECRRAVSRLMPLNVVAVVGRRNQRCVDVSCWSQLWPDVLPQHGQGAKHLRPIVLEEWQRRVVASRPQEFLRGLFHSDGSYFRNRVRAQSGALYSYDRYTFTNHSEDIKELFCWACSLIGVETRRMGPRAVSVARRASVARLNEFLGPKR